MNQPDHIQYEDAERAPLYRDVQGLVVWVADHFGGGADLADGSLLKKPPGRPSPMTNQRRFSEEAEGFSPEFQSKTNGRCLLEFLVLIVLREHTCNFLLQAGRCKPGRTKQNCEYTQRSYPTFPSEMQENIGKEHDRYSDQRRSRSHHKCEISQKTQSEQSQYRRERELPLPDKSDDGICQGYRTQPKFLALIDIVFNWDAVIGVSF